MEIDVLGRVRNTKLPLSNSLFPLFEAVVNSIYAVGEAGGNVGRIDVEILRDAQQSLGGELGERFLPEIEGFRVTDNGIGFTEENFKSFLTLDSRVKSHRGAKGIGRVLWLKAFTDVHVSSTYEEDGEWHVRTFDFRLSPVGIENDKLDPTKEHRRATTVHLDGFIEKYRGESPKSAGPIARRLVEHCLEHFVLGTAPAIFVHDAMSEETINVQDIYRHEYLPEEEPREFSVGEHTFVLLDILLKPSSGNANQLHFCAHDRAVKKEPLRDKLPHLDTALFGEDGQQYFYAGYVTGRLLDESVDAERTSFSLDKRGELGLGAHEASWDDILEAAVAAAQEYLGPRTDSARQQALDRVRKYVETSEPRYRPLLTHRTDELQSLSVSLSPEKLDGELHKILNRWREDVRLDANASLAETDGPVTDFDDYQTRVERVLGEIQEVAKSELADYVRQRWMVLSFFEKLLGRQPDGAFSLEDALHGLFFPLRTDSNQVDFDDHNLWILDDRLAYHGYLASDLPFSKQDGPVDVSSKDRPDVLVYNTPTAFSPDDSPSSVVVVEFKRPERTGYPVDETPLDQVLRYVEQIREGDAKRPDGSSMQPLRDIPFYCYVVATLNKRLRGDAERLGFTTTPDRQGYFNFNRNYNAYIEVVDYRKVLDDAKKRNRAFFERLEMKMPTALD